MIDVRDTLPPVIGTMLYFVDARITMVGNKRRLQGRARSDFHTYQHRRFHKP